MSESLAEQIVALRVAGASREEICSRLSISPTTVGRHLRGVPAPPRTCAQCGRAFTGRTNATFCSRSCWRERTNASRCQTTASLREDASARGWRVGRDCLACGEAVSRPGRWYCGQHGSTVGRPRSEAIASESAALRGVSVEEFIEARRPPWARDPGPRADAWSGYSADAAEASF